MSSEHFPECYARAMAAKKARLLSVKKSGVVRSSKQRQELESARGLFASISPERLLSDELIRERRQEASAHVETRSRARRAQAPVD